MDVSWSVLYVLYPREEEFKHLNYGAVRASSVCSARSQGSACGHRARTPGACLRRHSCVWCFAVHPRSHLQTDMVSSKCFSTLACPVCRWSKYLPTRAEAQMYWLPGVCGRCPPPTGAQAVELSAEEWKVAYEGECERAKKQTAQLQAEFQQCECQLNTALDENRAHKRAGGPAQQTVVPPPSTPMKRRAEDISSSPVQSLPPSSTPDTPCTTRKKTGPFTQSSHTTPNTSEEVRLLQDEVRKLHNNCAQVNRHTQMIVQRIQNIDIIEDSSEAHSLLHELRMELDGRRGSYIAQRTSVAVSPILAHFEDKTTDVKSNMIIELLQTLSASRR